MIRKKAEDYYRNGDYFCSESIVKTIKDEFGLNVPDDVIAMASGFPIGIGGSGCTCGAIVGGIMALGLFFGRTNPKDEKVKKVILDALDGLPEEHEHCAQWTADTLVMAIEDYTELSKFPWKKVYLNR